MANSPCRDRNISVWRCCSYLWMGRQRPHVLTHTYTQAPNILRGTIPKRMVNRSGFIQHVPPTVTAIRQIPQTKDLYLSCLVKMQLVLLQESSCPFPDCGPRKAVGQFFGPCIHQELLGHTVFPVLVF